MNEALPDRACWTSVGAHSVLRTEALSNPGEVFLATHTPVESFDVEGSEAATVLAKNERGLLDSLSDDERVHAFAVVQGEPGSGKSHLIRWLSAMWPKGRDVTVLLSRADASLEGSLRGLRDAIPPEYRDAIGNIEVRQQATMSGRIADFISGLTNALAPDYFDQPLPDRQFCANFTPGEILRLPEVCANWKAPARIVGLLAGAGGMRNSESASFTVYEVTDLVTYLKAVTSISQKAGRLLDRIQRELDVIEQSERAGISSERLLATRRSEIPHAAGLTEALNARRNHAIQNSLGVSAEKLKETFLDLRRALRKNNRRLIILLEDITAWEGIDDSLIDVLIVDAAIKPDLCPQVAVVGVTPYYHLHLAGNYKQRITHDVSLGRADGRLQDVANLREPSTRTKFVARYLAAARIGEEPLRAWRDRLRLNPDEPVPNACDSCPLHVRPGCHAAFGEVDGYGLYPFSDRAIGGFFAALKQQDGAMTWQTPRGMIQGILVPTLTRPAALANGTYPTAEVETHSGIDRDRTFVTGNPKRLLDARLPDIATRERARRLIAFWGDRTSSETSLCSDGDLAYADVPKSIFDSFRITWIGGETPIAPELSPENDATFDKPQAEAGPEKGTATEDLPPTEIEGRQQASRGSGRPQLLPTPIKPRIAQAPLVTRPFRPQEVDTFLNEVESFRRDGTIRTPSLWNRLAVELVTLLDAARLDADPFLIATLFKEDLVKVEGTTAASRGNYFQLPAAEWMLDGLVAQAELRSSEHFNGKSAQEQDATRRAVARCLRRMEILARAHVARRMPRLSDGTVWSHSGTLAQVLIVRAWLRGDVAPDAPVERQWWAVLQDEGVVVTDPRSRVESWNEILQLTDKRHDDMRRSLRLAVALPQGGSSTFGLANASTPIAGIIFLQEHFRMGERPANPDRLGIDDVLRVLLDAADSISGKLSRLPADEFDRLRSRAARIEESRRELGVLDHLTRVDTAVTIADENLPVTRRSGLTPTWKSELARLRAWTDVGRRIEAVEDSLEPLLDQEARPSNRLALLTSAAMRPAGDVEAVDKLFSLGEQVITDTLERVSDLVREAGSGGLSLDDVRERGTALASATKATLVVWVRND